MKVSKETKAYKPIPVITDFTDENGNDNMEQMVMDNYIRIKSEVKQIVADELERVKQIPDLARFIKQDSE